MDSSNGPSENRKPHRRLTVWQRSVELVKLVYGLTRSFPAHERYGLSQQMQRAAVSIPSNIAEGAARHTRKEYAQFLHMARGSLSELDTQFEIAAQLGYVTETDCQRAQSCMDEVSKMLYGLILALARRSS